MHTPAPMPQYHNPHPPGPLCVVPCWSSSPFVVVSCIMFALLISSVLFTSAVFTDTTAGTAPTRATVHIKHFKGGFTHTQLVFLSVVHGLCFFRLHGDNGTFYKIFAPTPFFSIVNILPPIADTLPPSRNVRISDTFLQFGN
jgi:hypothetical protein